MDSSLFDKVCHGKRKSDEDLPEDGVEEDVVDYMEQEALSWHVSDFAEEIERYERDNDPDSFEVMQGPSTNPLFTRIEMNYTVYNKFMSIVHAEKDRDLVEKFRYLLTFGLRKEEYMPCVNFLDYIHDPNPEVIQYLQMKFVALVHMRLDYSNGQNVSLSDLFQALLALVIVRSPLVIAKVILGKKLFQQTMLVLPARCSFSCARPGNLHVLNHLARSMSYYDLYTESGEQKTMLSLLLKNVLQAGSLMKTVKAVCLLAINLSPVVGVPVYLYDDEPVAIFYAMHDVWMASAFYRGVFVVKRGGVFVVKGRHKYMQDVIWQTRLSLSSDKSMFCEPLLTPKFFFSYYGNSFSRPEKFYFSLGQSGPGVIDPLLETATEQPIPGITAQNWPPEGFSQLINCRGDIQSKIIERLVTRAKVYFRRRSLDPESGFVFEWAPIQQKYRPSEYQACWTLVPTSALNVPSTDKLELAFSAIDTFVRVVEQLQMMQCVFTGQSPTGLEATLRISRSAGEMFLLSSALVYPAALMKAIEQVCNERKQFNLFVARFGAISQTFITGIMEATNYLIQKDTNSIQFPVKDSVCVFVRGERKEKPPTGPDASKQLAEFHAISTAEMKAALDKYLFESKQHGSYSDFYGKMVGTLMVLDTFKFSTVEERSNPKTMRDKVLSRIESMKFKDQARSDLRREIFKKNAMFALLKYFS